MKKENYENQLIRSDPWFELLRIHYTKFGNKKENYEVDILLMDYTFSLLYYLWQKNKQEFKKFYEESNFLLF